MNPWSAWWASNGKEHCGFQCFERRPTLGKFPSVCPESVMTPTVDSDCGSGDDFKLWFNHISHLFDNSSLKRQMGVKPKNDQTNYKCS